MKCKMGCGPWGKQQTNGCRTDANMCNSSCNELGKGAQYTGLGCPTPGQDGINQWKLVLCSMQKRSYGLLAWYETGALACCGCTGAARLQGSASPQQTRAMGSLPFCGTGSRLRCRTGCGQTRWHAPSRAPPASGCGGTPAGAGIHAGERFWLQEQQAAVVIRAESELGRINSDCQGLLHPACLCQAGATAHCNAKHTTAPPGGASPVCARPEPPGSLAASSGTAS